MQRVVLAAAVLLIPSWGQDLPVISVAGGPAQAPRTAQSAPAGRLPPQPVTQIDPREITLDSPRRVSLTFLEPRPIDEVLALLTAGTPFSVAIDADAKGSFRGDLKQLTLRDALTAMLAPLGLEIEQRGTVLRVRRRQQETRLFDLNLLNVQRGFTRTAGAGDAAGALDATVAADDVFAGIGDGVHALLSEGGRAHLDRRAGLVQVTDYPERLDKVAHYIEALQLRSGRQVRLQAQVFEVTLRDGGSIDWAVVRERLGLPADLPQAGFAADPAALRGALQAQGEVRALWAPDVTTINNEPAIVRVATPGDTSLAMTIVPQVSAEGIVQLSVSHTWQEHAGLRRDGESGWAPLTRTSEADTVMRVMDGNTVMISGLLRPAPVDAGSAAAATTHATAELVMLLRPTIVTPGSFVSQGRR